MLGAIAGDVIGSVYERGGLKSMQFPLFVPGSRFTDDTVCTVALADSLLTGSDYAPLLQVVSLFTTRFHIPQPITA